MADAIICRTDLTQVTGVTITATNTIASLPAANLVTPSYTEIMRCTGVTTQIDITLPATAACSALYLGSVGDTAITGLSTFTIKGSATALGNTDVLSWVKGSLLVGQNFQQDLLYRYAVATWGEVSPRYIRIDITATGAAAFEAGRLYLGQAFAVSQNIGYPLTISPESISTQAVMESGEILTFQRPLASVYDIRWGDGITTTELATVRENIDLAHQQGDQVLFIGDPEQNVGAALGVVTRAGPASLHGFGRMEKGFELRGVG